MCACSDRHINMTTVREVYSEGSTEESAVQHAARLAIVMGHLLFELLLIVGEYCLASK